MKNAVTCFLLLFSYLAPACPACNVHNYLASSVFHSGQVFRGTVVAVSDEHKITVRVEQILKMSKEKLQVGDTVVKTMYQDSKVGDSFIFSNPTSRGPRYPVLATIHQWEIEHLIAKDTVMDGLEEALRCLEGVSYYTVSLGRDYIRQHFSESVPFLISKTVDLISEAETDPAAPFLSFRLQNLADALLLANSELATSYLLSNIESIRFAAVDFSQTGFSPDSPAHILGEFLTEVLDSSGDLNSFPMLCQAMLKHVLSDTSAAVSVYAYAIAKHDPSLKDLATAKVSNRAAMEVGLIAALKEFDYFWQQRKAIELSDAMGSMHLSAETVSYLQSRK